MKLHNGQLSDATQTPFQVKRCSPEVGMPARTLHERIRVTECIEVVDVVPVKAARAFLDDRTEARSYSMCWGCTYSCAAN